MKKLLFVFLCLLSSSLYPLTLTRKDRAIIASLYVGSMGLGSATMLALFRPTINLALYLNPLPVTPADNAYVDANFRKWLTYVLITYGAIPVILIGVPVIGIVQLTERLAALYIVRKYKISYQEALEFMKKYPFEDDEVKAYFNNLRKAH